MTRPPSPLVREPVQSLWIGEFSAVERLCVKSFLANGHPFHLYTYGEIAGVPDGATILDASEILPESAVFHLRSKEGKGSLTGFADWFRWQMLFMHGGWWVDMDMLCLRPFEFGRDIVFGLGHDYSPCISAMRFPAGHPASRLMTMQAKRPYSFAPWDSPKMRWRKFFRGLRRGNRPDSIKWSEGAGMKAFSGATDYFQLQKLAEHFYCFNPVSYYEWREVFNGKLAGGIARLEYSHALHLSNEAMRGENFNKTDEFPSNSVFEILRQRYEGTQQKIQNKIK